MVVNYIGFINQLRQLRQKAHIADYQKDTTFTSFTNKGLEKDATPASK